MPVPLDKGFTISCFVDADHVGELVTRIPRTGYVVMMNNAPIYWHTKKMASIETSKFGSESMIMKQASAYARGLRYKLRILGIPGDGSTFIFGDTQSVVCNTSMCLSLL